MSQDPQLKNLVVLRRINLHKHRLGRLHTRRYYSNRAGFEEKNFYEWLSGLTDSEGSFMLFRRQDGYAFKFQIQLHIDDLKVLHFIHRTLVMGNIYITGSAARFVISNASDTQKI